MGNAMLKLFASNFERSGDDKNNLLSIFIWHPDKELCIYAGRIDE
jgi:hypothetical protein